MKYFLVCADWRVQISFVSIMYDSIFVESEVFVTERFNQIDVYSMDGIIQLINLIGKCEREQFVENGLDCRVLIKTPSKLYVDWFERDEMKCTSNRIKCVFVSCCRVQCRCPATNNNANTTNFYVCMLFGVVQ